MNRNDRREKYPECAKLSDNADERRTALEFIEWLEGQGLHICERSPGSNFDTYHRTMRSHDDLAMCFLEIDRTKLEEERRAMLEAARGLPEGPEASHCDHGVSLDDDCGACEI